MKLLSDLNRIDRFDASWAAIERREGATLRQLKSIATVRSVGASTRIEGSKMTDAEVEVLIDHIKVARLEERDEQEVAGYFRVLDTISEYHKDIRITEAEVKNLHKMLMQFSDKDEWHRGDYKQHQNSVDETSSAGIKRTIFRTTEPGYATEDAMRQLIAWYNTDKESIPIVKIALFVYEFLTIHPFQDGNGRLSRLLSTLLLLQNGYTWIQYVSFEHEIENRKTEYYSVLMQTQRQRPGENVTAWLAFFTHCLLNIQDQLDEKLRKKQAQVNLSTREQRILAFIDNHPESSSGVIAKKLNIPLPTVKKILAGLVEKKVISKIGIGKGTTYINEASKLRRENAMFTLNNDNQVQEFLLQSAIHSIEIRKIILQARFSWERPDEWFERLYHQLRGFTITGYDNRGGRFSNAFSIVGMVSPHHYQPVFSLDPPIDVPLTIKGEQPAEADYPIRVIVELNTLTMKIDFDVLFIFNEIA